MLPHEIWLYIADILNSPYDFENLAIVSKEMNRIFTSDQVWRFYNVEGLDEGFRKRFLTICSRFQRPEGVFYYSLNNLVVKADRLLEYQQRGSIPHDLDELDEQFAWCIVNTVRVRDRFFVLPKVPLLAAKVLERCQPNAEFLDFPEQLLESREVLLWAFMLKSSCFSRIKSIPKKFWNDRELMMAAFINSSSFAETVDSSLLHDPVFMRQVTIENAMMLKFASAQLRDNAEFLYLCNFNRQPSGFRYVSERIRTDKSLVKQILIEAGVRPHHATSCLIESELNRRDLLVVSLELAEEMKDEYVFSLMRPTILEFLELVYTHPQCYRLASTEFQHDVNLLLKAVSADGSMYQYAPKCLKRCRRVVTMATKTDPEMAKFVPYNQRMYIYKS